MRSWNHRIICILCLKSGWNDSSKSSGSYITHNPTEYLSISGLYKCKYLGQLAHFAPLWCIAQFLTACLAACSWSCVNISVDRAPLQSWGPVPRLHFHTPLRGNKLHQQTFEPFFPLMKLIQNPLTCSFSAAGEMCLHVLSQSKRLLYGPNTMSDT